MKVLLIGGSGHVASLIIPTLQKKHSVRVYDLVAPKDETLEFSTASVTDYEGLSRALKGMDALIYMAMGSLDWDEWPGTDSGFDANVKGLHFALKAAAKEGIRQAVYCSSMSVYADIHARHFSDEGLTPDETNLYGFTKYLGEKVCENAWRRWGINTNALRLCLPTEKREWQAKIHKELPYFATADEDVANAMLAALEFKGGFQAFMISGDYEQKGMNMSKAKQLLNWEPLARP